MNTRLKVFGLLFTTLSIGFCSFSVVNASNKKISSDDYKPTTEKVTTEQSNIDWLLIRIGASGGAESIEKIQVNSKDQCEELGAHFLSSKKMHTHWNGPSELNGFECLEGSRGGNTWLVIRLGIYGRNISGVDKILMRSLEHCEEQGSLIKSSKRFMGTARWGRSRDSWWIGYECFEVN